MRGWERERERKRKKETFHFSCLLPCGHNNLGASRPKLGLRTLSGSPIWVARAQALEPWFSVFPDTLAGCWIESRTAGVKPWPWCGMAASHVVALHSVGPQTLLFSLFLLACLCDVKVQLLHKCPSRILWIFIVYISWLRACVLIFLRK